MAEKPIITLLSETSHAIEKYKKQLPGCTVNTMSLDQYVQTPVPSDVLIVDVDQYPHSREFIKQQSVPVFASTYTGFYGENLEEKGIFGCLHPNTVSIDQVRKYFYPRNL